MYVKRRGCFWLLVNFSLYSVLEMLWGKSDLEDTLIIILIALYIGYQNMHTWITKYSTFSEETKICRWRVQRTTITIFNNSEQPNWAWSSGGYPGGFPTPPGIKPMELLVNWPGLVKQSFLLRKKKKKKENFCALWCFNWLLWAIMHENF